MLIELGHRQARIEDVGHQDRAVQPLHHPAQDGGLAGADFAAHNDQALATLNAVVQVRHHLGMRRRKVDKARIRRQGERQFS